MQYPRILILGGGGRTGRWLVREALASGYQVTALLRRPEALQEMACAKLTLLEGDARNADDIALALSLGQDAVLSTLGLFHKTTDTPLADMTAILLQQLVASGPKRLVVMSSLGAGDSAGQGNLVVRYVTGVVLRYVLADKNVQETRIRDSGLAWSVLRPPRLVAGGDRKPYQLWQGAASPAGVRWKISCRDAAAEMLRMLEDPAAIGVAQQCSY